VAVGEHTGLARAAGTRYRLAKIRKIKAAYLKRTTVLLLVVNISSLLT
jgi:hypothetical protein